MLYELLKRCTSIFFNLFNLLLGGKLPPFGSAGVIVEENDQYLVVELPGNRFVFPGGFMTWREDPREAAQREGHEETGLLLEADDLINYYPCPSSGWTNMSTVSFIYHARVIGGTLHNNAEGKPCWLPEPELRTRLTGHSRLILDDYLRYRTRHKSPSHSPENLSLVS
ncbi:MAG TPA: NUDIX hydrolase [Ktedonobacteraceae bacterium]|nr:NUDIX hydrolase [Ktedonobacteraceae bacterium]